MSYDDWLLAQGYTQDENGKWRLPEGGILSDDQYEYLRNADYAQWQEANASGAYGTEGVAPGDDLKFFSTADRSVTINGENYIRVGEDSTNSAAVPYFQEILAQHPEYKQFLYNDQYGWIVPEAIWTTLGNIAQANNQDGGIAGFLDNGGGVFLLAAAFGAMAAGASAAAAADVAASSTAEAAALPASYDSMFAGLNTGTVTDAVAAPLAEAGSDLTLSQLSALADPQLAMQQSLVPQFAAQTPITSSYALGAGAALPAVEPSFIDKALNLFTNTPSSPYPTTSSTTTTPTGITSDPLKLLSAGGTVAGAAAALGGGGGEIAPTGADYLGEPPPTFSQTPEEWAQSIGAKLNPDGTINWDSVDQTDLLKSLGFIDSGAVDPGKLGISDALAKLLGVPTGGTSSGSMDASTAAKSALGRILNGTATADDWAKLLGTAGSTALGVLGANKQADAYREATDKFLGLGAPYREKLTASYQPGFDLTKTDPQFNNALNTSADTVLRRLSASSGNPFDNPGAMTEAMRYVTGNTYLPQLNTYRSQLGSFGGLGVNTAGTAATAGAQNSGGVYDALGYGLGQLTGNPYSQNKSLADLLRGSNLNLGSLF